ncbi:hypothetical protein KAZ57_01640 [Patescibacteria group bacterium]|nr:hypothetical protein [Patescibacteria group bacterium]
MATLKELRDERIKKLKELKSLGIEPYPAETYKNIEIGRLLENFDKYTTDMTVAGRIKSIRRHGKLTFVDIRDATGTIQLYLNQSILTADLRQNQISYNHLNLLDTGDFVEACGKPIILQSGQKSIETKSLRFLGKALRPLPDSWDGLKDKETRLRRRYIDTNVNEDVYQRFLRRAKFWKAHRDFFESKGFIEMNIPVLEHIPGGGDATPFITHMESIDEDFYLRISQELPLKRLIGGGYEKVFEIGPRFRNEGLSDEHLPEHMAMEFYWAYADWKDGMEFIKELLNYVIKEVYGDKKVFSIRGFDVDFSKGWEVIDFGEIFEKEYGIDIYNPDLEKIKAELVKKKVKIDFDVNIPRGIDNLWKQLRKNIAGPAFLINHPKYLSPLQKPSKTNPNMVERFQPIIAGSELGNGWTEVNDPIDQFDRFSEQQAMRDSGDGEAQWLDIDYVEMLEYGMPPTFGYGHAERTFWFLEDVSAKEGVIFPQMKFELEETTREIYNLPSQNEKKINFVKDTKYTITEQVKKDFPGMLYAYTVIENVNVEKTNPELEKFKEQVLAKLSGKNIEYVNSLPAIDTYKKIYKQTGVDWRSKAPSPLALLKRVVTGKGLYTVNTAVDAYNLAVLESGIGLGGFDFEYIKEPVTLRYSKAGEKMHLLGDEQETTLEDGALVYADDEKLITLNLNYRDINETKITEKTKNIILFADGGPGIERDGVLETLQKGSDYITKFCGGTQKTIYLVD